MNNVKTYTFDDLVESQEFEHGDLFVKAELYAILESEIVILKNQYKDVLTKNITLSHKIDDVERENKEYDRLMKQVCKVIIEATGDKNEKEISS